MLLGGGTTPVIGDTYGGIYYYVGDWAASGGGVRTHRIICDSGGWSAGFHNQTISYSDAVSNIPPGFSIPTIDQLKTLYFNFKPTTTANNTSYGSNAYAVSPEPISTNHTSGSPAQTDLTAWQDGQSKAFEPTNHYWSSTAVDGTHQYAMNFDTGEIISLDVTHYYDWVKYIKLVAI